VASRIGLVQVVGQIWLAQFWWGEPILLDYDAGGWGSRELRTPNKNIYIEKSLNYSPQL